MTCRLGKSMVCGIKFVYMKAVMSELCLPPLLSCLSVPTVSTSRKQIH
jgi:hypothetical protein